MSVSECISQGLMVRLTQRAQPLGFASSLPRPRSKELAFRNGLQRSIIEVGRIEVNCVTPPVQRPTSTGIDNSEEDDESSHSEAEIKSE